METEQKKVVFLTPQYMVVVNIEPAYEEVLFNTSHEYFKSFGLEDEVLGELYDVASDGTLETVLEAQFSLFRDFTSYSDRQFRDKDYGIVIYDYACAELAMDFDPTISDSFDS